MLVQCGRTVDENAARDRPVYELIAPSPEHALMLNKAYREIVGEQGCDCGRDAAVVPPRNVQAQINDATAPMLPRELRFSHDIRLD